MVLNAQPLEPLRVLPNLAAQTPPDALSLLIRTLGSLQTVSWCIRIANAGLSTGADHVQSDLQAGRSDFVTRRF